MMNAQMDTRQRNGALGLVLLLVVLSAWAACAADFTVDFSKPVGRIRRINGISNCLPLIGSKGGRYRGLLKPLEAPRTHLHDDAW